MKKIIVSILICYFIMFSLVGCTKNKNNFSIGKVSNIKILEKGVSLSIILFIAHSCHGILLSDLKSLHILLSILQRHRRKYIFADASWRTGNQLPE